MYTETGLCRHDLMYDEPEELNRLFEQMLKEVEGQLERLGIARPSLNQNKAN